MTNLTALRLMGNVVGDEKRPPYPKPLPASPFGQALMPTMFDPRVKAFPKHEQGASIIYRTPESALTRDYFSDAHTAGYCVPAIKRRLDKGASGHPYEGSALAVPMCFLFFDIDGADHKAEPGWRKAELQKVTQVLAAHPGGFFYETRGGYRLVWRLEQAFLLRTPEDALAWKAFYWSNLLYLSRTFSIVGDPTCADWTRLYRLPHATRPKVDGSPGENPENLDSSGDPSLAIPWMYQPDPSHLAGDVEEARRLQSGVISSAVASQGRMHSPWSPVVKALTLTITPRSAPEVQQQKPVPSLPKATATNLAWARCSVRKEVQTLVSMARGGRNNAVRDAGLRLGHLVPHLLNKNDVEQALLEACKINGLVEDDGQDAAMTTIRRAIQDAMAEPRLPSVDPWSYALTETGNAERLVDKFGDDLRYCSSWGKWLTWDGRRWTQENAGRVQQCVKQTVLGIRDEVKAIPADAQGNDKLRREQLISWLKNSQSLARRKATETLAQSEPIISVTHDSLDQNLWLLNVQNGVLDLRTGSLHEHRRTDLITQLAPVVYDPDARAPIFLDFLSTITGGDTDLQGFMQRLFGYALTGDIREQVLLNFYGTGSNGKSTLLKLFLEMMGDYAYQAPADLLLAKNGESHPTEKVGLFKRRLVVCMEVPMGRHMNEAQMKALTGGDRVSARRMREDFWEFDPTHKLVICSNHQLIMRTSDHGTWRRQKMVPFLVQIPDDKQDKSLPDKLRAEFPGVLRWALDGCIQWQGHGLGQPSAVEQATAKWRQESDPLSAFLESACEVDPESRIAPLALYLSYQTFAQSNGEEVMPAANFAARMRERQFEQGRTGGQRFWKGLHLKAQTPSRSDNE